MPSDAREVAAAGGSALARMANTSAIAGPKGRVRSAAAMVGATAVDVEGEAIGEVTDLMIEVASGRIAYVVIAVGATLGFGGERYPVPWSALAHDAEAGEFRLHFSKAHLAAAPVVEPEFWPEMTDDERWARAVHDHFATARSSEA